MVLDDGYDEAEGLAGCDFVSAQPGEETVVPVWGVVFRSLISQWVMVRLKSELEVRNQTAIWLCARLSEFIYAQPATYSYASGSKGWSYLPLQALASTGPTCVRVRGFTCGSHMNQQRIVLSSQMFVASSNASTDEAKMLKLNFWAA